MTRLHFAVLCGALAWLMTSGQAVVASDPLGSDNPAVGHGCDVAAAAPESPELTAAEIVALGGKPSGVRIGTEE